MHHYASLVSSLQRLLWLAAWKKLTRLFRPSRHACGLPSRNWAVLPRQDRHGNIDDNKTPTNSELRVLPWLILWQYWYMHPCHWQWPGQDSDSETVTHTKAHRALPIFTHLDYAHICAFVCATTAYHLLPGVVATHLPVRGPGRSSSKPGPGLHLLLDFVTLDLFFKFETLSIINCVLQSSH